MRAENYAPVQKTQEKAHILKYLYNMYIYVLYGYQLEDCTPTL